MPQAMKILDAKELQWTKNGRSSKTCQYGSDLGKRVIQEAQQRARNKNEVIAEARNEGRKVHFASLMDLCHLQKSELEPQYQKYKGRVVLRGENRETRLWLLCSVHRARIVCFPNDSSKGNGCHLQELTLYQHTLG